MAEPPPLVICMDNVNGDEVSLKIDPQDDFRLFLDKARSQLGYEVNLNSITGNQPVSLNDNIYQFLMNSEQNLNTDLNDPYKAFTDIEGTNDGMVYVLDDGTQINSSQIQFDNEDPLIDITMEKIPFIKHRDDVEEEINNDDFSLKDFNIDSPVSRWSSRNSSPTRSKSFINSLPFKLVSNTTLNFDVQYPKYLESNKAYGTLNQTNIISNIQIKDNFKKYDDQKQKDVLTREDILNMFKDSPVNSLPYDRTIYDKRKHARKSDPSRVVYKNWFRSHFSSDQSQDCCICGKTIQNNYEKMYLFDNEDQKIHRCLPQKRTSVKLKIICEQCLEENFQLGLAKSPNEPLGSDEYLVIKNNQQYIFQNTTDIGLKKKFLDKDSTEKKEEIKESSSDVEIIEPEAEIDKVIDNLENADEGVKEFLGKYQSNDLKELKCRFCEKIFADLQEVTEHCEQHKHDVEDGIVFPCPLCDYGYELLKWLKGHVKAAHDYTQTEENKERDEDNSKSTEVDGSPKTSEKFGTETNDKENQDKAGGEPENISMEPPLHLVTEVKQEALDSDEEAIWILHTGDDQEEQLQNLLKRNEEKHDPISKKLNDLTKHKCFNCSRIFPNADTLDTHKCRKRGRKRKSTDTNVVCVPSEEDFLKRAQGRPRQSKDDNKLKVRKKRNRSGSPQIVTCNDCNESFSSKVRLKFHMQFHEKTTLKTEDGQYKCNECTDPIFTTETELFDHVHFQHSKQKRWQCPVKDCGKMFYLRGTLTKHSRTHTDTRRYVCVTCGKRFLDKQTLDEHGVTHLQIKPFQCHICLKQLTRRSRLRMHLRAHEEELSPKLVLVCGICSRAFRDHTEAQEHVTKSAECLEAFTNEIKQDEEMQQLSPTSGLVTVSEKTESSLSQPIPREVSREEGEPLLRVLDDAAKTIIRVVRIEKAFRCEYCEDQPIPREVSREEGEPLLRVLDDAAKTIIRVVRIEKAFRCEYCEDVFYIEEALNKHRLIHKGIKNPFICHVCKVTFATYSRCTTHKTTHGFYKRNTSDGNKEDNTSAGILGYGGFPVVKHFLCEDCGRSYLHWTYLQVHRRMKHANENFLYKCNQCELTFPNSWSVAYHRKKIHGKTAQEDGEATKIARQDYYRIPCRDCDQVLSNKIELYKHRQKEHSDKTLEPGYEELIDKDCTICPKCGHNLHNVNALQKHLSEVHDSEKSSCPVCSRTFRSASLRNAHLRTHSTESPYSCDICGATFKRPTAMRNHIQTHKDSREWSCSHCERRFRVRSELRAHIRSQHPFYMAVIEIEGLNPTNEKVLHHLNLNNIKRNRAVEISVMSFPKGTTSIIPNTQQALSMLKDVPRTEIKLDKQIDVQGLFPEATHPYTPTILQHNTRMYNEPTYPSNATEMQPINVELLLQEGALLNSYYNNQNIMQ